MKVSGALLFRLIQSIGVFYDFDINMEDHAPSLPEVAPETFENKWVENLSNEDYHSKKDHINAGGIREILRSPFHYYQACLGNKREDTASMILGTLIHKALLEPNDFISKTIVMPEFNSRSNAGKLEKAEWLKAHESRIIVDQKQSDIISSILDSIAKMPELVGILSDGHKEISGFFRDPESGFKCRIRPDILIAADTVNAIPPYVIDVKTTRDASKEAFTRSILNYSYHVSAAFYLHGASIISGQQIENFQWIAVENVPPYAVACYEMDRAWLEIGEHLFKKALRTLKECMSKNEWPGYQVEPEFISPPDWVLKRFENIYSEAAWGSEETESSHE